MRHVKWYRYKYSNDEDPCVEMESIMESDCETETKIRDLKHLSQYLNEEGEHDRHEHHRAYWYLDRHEECEDLIMRLRIKLQNEEG